MNGPRAVWMFLRLVFRVWDRQRVWPRDAWDIARAVWLTKYEAMRPKHEEAV